MLVFVISVINTVLLVCLLYAIYQSNGLNLTTPPPKAGSQLGKPENGKIELKPKPQEIAPSLVQKPTHKNVEQEMHNPSDAQKEEQAKSQKEQLSKAEQSSKVQQNNENKQEVVSLKPSTDINKSDLIKVTDGLLGDSFMNNMAKDLLLNGVVLKEAGVLNNKNLGPGKEYLAKFDAKQLKESNFEPINSSDSTIQ